MKSILLKVNDKIKDELNLIREEEGLGNQTATVIYLIKYYFLTKKSQLDVNLAVLDKLLDKIELKSLPSVEKQLSEL